MLASYSEQLHPWAPKEPLAPTVLTMIAQVAGYAAFRKEEEQETTAKCPQASMRPGCGIWCLADVFCLGKVGSPCYRWFCICPLSPVITVLGMSICFAFCWFWINILETFGKVRAWLLAL